MMRASIAWGGTMTSFNGSRPARRILRILKAASRATASFRQDEKGSFATYAALIAVPLIVGASVAVEYSNASRQRSELQQVLDASVLAGAREKSGQVKAAETFFRAYVSNGGAPGASASATFKLGDGVLDGQATRPMELSLGLGFLAEDHTIRVASQARFTEGKSAAPCITVLADVSQAFLVNSGATVNAKECEIHVHSQQNPAMILNAGSALDVSKVCVHGQNIIQNGGTISKLEKGCAVEPDPYAGKIPTPSIPGSCTTSGARDGSNHVLQPGKHCSVNFNGTPTITFAPGLHIISGPMMIGSGANIVAEGVTFYFPDSNSELRANGQLRIKATAPTSGPYAGILMFEKAGGNKTPFIFNGSLGEQLEGVIYLPNRNVTYNSKTNIQSNRISLVANTVIVNNANWNFQGFGSGGNEERMVYLSR
jgi:hypothetical protein